MTQIAVGTIRDTGQYIGNVVLLLIYVRQSRNCAVTVCKSAEFIILYRYIVLTREIRLVPI